MCKLINKDLIFLDFEAKDKLDLLSKLSKILFDKGYVKETFYEGLINREKVFPTGLVTEGPGVAIPHTDSKHVKKAVMLVAKLKKPVIFKEMADGINDVPAELIFMLAIDNPNEQVMTLSKLMGIFSSKQILNSLKNASDKEEIFSILSKQLN